MVSDGLVIVMVNDGLVMVSDGLVMVTDCW